MNPEQRTDILKQIADVIARRRLTTPARIALDMIAPIGFIASQVALFVRPLTPHGRWHGYVGALAHEQSWEVLRSLIDQHDC